jgi:hypothetical protein
MKTEYKVTSTAITLGAALLLGDLPEFPQQNLSVKSIRAAYYVDQTLSTMSRSVWTLDVFEPKTDAFKAAASELYANLSRTQSRLPRDVERLLDDHAWELYSRTV